MAAKKRNGWPTHRNRIVREDGPLWPKNIDKLVQDEVDKADGVLRRKHMYDVVITVRQGGPAPCRYVNGHVRFTQEAPTFELALKRVARWWEQNRSQFMGEPSTITITRHG